VVPEAPWRVVIVTRIPPVAAGFHAAVTEAGHEPVALLTIRDTENRYGPEFTTPDLLGAWPQELDVLIPGRRSAIAPLLASVEPDLVVCMGFPWKIPADALALPALGWLNGHPSLLPRHRGPIPVAWAIRAGDDEIGITFHRMDAELDTGAIVAQTPIPLGEYVEPDELYGRMGVVILGTLVEALGRLAAGEPGAAQSGGDYEGFFGDEDAWLDLSRPRDDVHRLVWAWRYAFPRGGPAGALVALESETVRVLASSLDEVDGARRVECGDGPLWILVTEPVASMPEPAEATRTSAPAPSTR
jgi:methionyl-tRNA formyltransferase